MIISVHIPKTGGLSFSTLLKSNFKDRLLLDYNDKPMKDTSALRTQKAMDYRLKADNLSDRYDCIHGHFLPVKYATTHQENYFAVWFRDPVQRVISRYQYGKRSGQGIAASMSLEEFCGVERFHNLYAKYLWGFNVKMFSFIGITENYETSVEIFRRQFNLQPSTEFKVCNKNPHKIHNQYKVNDDLRKFISQTNRDDYEIYYEAVEINSQLENKYLL